MTGPHWKLEDDRKTVTITFPSDPVVQLHYDLAAIEEMIENLGMMRNAMLPEVAREYPPGQRVAAVPDPIWRTEPDIMAGDSLLHIRDPRYGWLHYLIPREEARKLSEFLQAQADNPPLAPPQGKMN